MPDFSVLSQEVNRVTISSFDDASVGLELAAVTSSATSPASAAYPTANRAISIPFRVYQPLVAVKLFAYNGTAVSGNIDVGIEDDQGDLLVSAGSTAQAGAAGLQLFDVTDTLLLPGIFYMSVALDNTTGTLLRAAPAQIGFLSLMGILSQSTAFPLPATSTWVSPLDAYVPKIGLTARTVV